jgi:hypothetical protein
MEHGKWCGQHHAECALFPGRPCCTA